MERTCAWNTPFPSPSDCSNGSVLPRKIWVIFKGCPIKSVFWFRTPCKMYEIKKHYASVSAYCLPWTSVPVTLPTYLASLSSRYQTSRKASVFPCLMRKRRVPSTWIWWNIMISTRLRCCRKCRFHRFSTFLFVSCEILWNFSTPKICRVLGKSLFLQRESVIKKSPIIPMCDYII